MMRPSPLSAAAIGALTAVDLLLFRLWMTARGPVDPVPIAACWVLAVVILIVVPAYFLVIGVQDKPLQRQWFKDPAEVSRVMAIANRVTVWFLAFIAMTVVLQFFRS